MSILIGLFVLTALVFLFLSYRWESSVRRPGSDKKSFVSILIPAYKSEKTIKKTIKSALSLDYPRKEIIVVNDSRDNTPKICKALGVKCIQNKKRLGKSTALNNAVKQANGDFLFFLDADTVARRNVLKNLLPWFKNKKVAAAVPKYITQNPNSFISKLSDIDNTFLASLFKIHMYFGSMVGFRGCGILIKKSVFEKLGGWPRTQMEDNHFAVTIIKNGYKIHYDPEAIVETKEPETINELRKQRLRWGKGAFYTFWHHKKAYKINNQFLISTLPYTLISFVFIVLVALNVYFYLLPAFDLFILSSSYKMSLFSILVVPQIINFVLVLIIGTVLHFGILILTENFSKKSFFYLAPYIFFYLPVVVYFYAKGAFFGVKDKIRRRDELDFDNW